MISPPTYARPPFYKEMIVDNASELQEAEQVIEDLEAKVAEANRKAAEAPVPQELTAAQLRRLVLRTAMMLVLLPSALVAVVSGPWLLMLMWGVKLAYWKCVVTTFVSFALYVIHISILARAVRPLVRE